MTTLSATAPSHRVSNALLAFGLLLPLGFLGVSALLIHAAWKFPSAGSQAAQTIETTMPLLMRAAQAHDLPEAQTFVQQAMDQGLARHAHIVVQSTAQGPKLVVQSGDQVLCVGVQSMFAKHPELDDRITVTRNGRPMGVRGLHCEFNRGYEAKDWQQPMEEPMELVSRPYNG